MKGWHAALSALLILSPRIANAADDLNGAARELARKTAALAGRGESVGLTWRNLSSLSQSDFGQARAAFEAALREAGNRVSDIAPLTEARITLSESPTQYLMVEESRKGEDHQVWMASWKRAGGQSTFAGISLEKKLLWEQEEQILDLAIFAGGMLVLSPSRLTWLSRQSGAWEPREAVPISPLRPWPRDLRGRLRATGTNLQVFLPGMVCAGSAETTLALDCKPADEPWVLESGSRYLLLGNFAATRNYFDGRIVTQSGARKTAPPFYSAAAVEDQGRTIWLLALVDGRTQVFDATMEPLRVLSGWGSDIAGTDARCGGGSQVLATRSSDATEPEAIQVFRITNGAPAPLARPVEFPGAVTALWTSGGNAALAVARDEPAGKYGAYLVQVVCGE